jgi:2-oxoglutarate ferredoxin oxidoreductase subunit alpha
MLERARKLVSVEQNYTSQMALLIRMETGISMHQHITKFDGRPFTSQWVADRVLEQVLGEARPRPTALEGVKS